MKYLRKEIEDYKRVGNKLILIFYGEVLHILHP